MDSGGRQHPGVAPGTPPGKGGAHTGKEGAHTGKEGARTGMGGARTGSLQIWRGGGCQENTRNFSLLKGNLRRLLNSAKECEVFRQQRCWQPS